MNRQRILIPGLIVAASLGGGLWLADYTVGGMWPGRPSEAFVWDGATTHRDASDGMVPHTAPPSRESGPGEYVCTGCGPTLAERQMQAMAAGYYPPDDVAGDTYGADPYQPVPSYQPEPVEEEIPAYEPIPFGGREEKQSGTHRDQLSRNDPDGTSPVRTGASSSDQL